MRELFSSDGFLPHAHCYLWKPELLWLHLISDLLIAVAYTTIPVILIYFSRKRRDVPFRWIFLWFGLFIVSCGSTHLFEAWNLYHAQYWLSGFAKAFTAVASLSTAFLLVRVMPEAIALPSPNALRRADAGLRESEERHRSLIEAASEMIITADIEGRFVTINAAFGTLTGWRAEQWLGRPFTEITHPADTAVCFAALEAVVRGEAVPAVTHRVRTAEGKWLTFESTATPLFRDGRVAAVLCISRDVTARIRTEAALSQSLRWLHALFENALDALLVVDDEGRYVGANPAAARLLGYTRDELLALTVRDVTPVEDEKQLPAAQDAFQEEGEYSGAYRLRRKDGSICDVELRSVANVLPGFHFAVARDVTARKRMEQEREALLRRLVHVQEEERRTISRELHDEVGQLLTGLRMMMERPDALHAAEQSEEMKRIVSELLERVRDLSMSLRPPMLDTLGVLPTLLWQIERFERQTEIAVHFRHVNLDRRFPAPIELAAFRVVQEALTNVAKHARVTSVEVEVWANEQNLGARIEDVGRGFNVEAAIAGHSSGLTGIRERCRLLRGRLRIESTPGAGARLLVELPVAGATEVSIES